MNILFFTSLKGVHGNKWLKAISLTQDVNVAGFSIDKQDKLPGITYYQVQPKKNPTPHKIIRGNNVKETSFFENKKSIKKKHIKDAWLTYKIGLRFAGKFASLIDKIDPDIVHAHQTLPFGWYAYLATRRSKKKPPLIVSAWGSDIISFTENSALNRHMNKKILRGATRVTTTGHFLRKRARRFLTKKSSLPQVIPFGIDLNMFTPKIRVPNQVTTFGVAKQLKPIYRIDMALRALAIAKQTNPYFKLEIAGAGEQQNNLKKLARHLGIRQAVNFLGAVAPDEMPAYMKKWDVLLNPTKQEGFGVVALEAAACGTPMIATNTGGLPEVTEPNKTAILLDHISPANLAEAMAQVAKDKSLINRCLSNGPVFVRRNFDWDKNVQSMLRLYHEVAK